MTGTGWRVERPRLRSSMATESPPVTPDGRYILVRGRLWRRANPHLPEADRQRHVDALMTARRDVARGNRAGVIRLRLPVAWTGQNSADNRRPAW